MITFAARDLTHLLTAYGYWVVLLFVAIESTGIPFPGETMLIAAAIYAGSTHHLALWLVITAAAAGAIQGDNLGFWVGREGGYRLLRRYGHPTAATAGTNLAPLAQCIDMRYFKAGGTTCLMSRQCCGLSPLVR